MYLLIEIYCRLLLLDWFNDELFFSAIAPSICCGRASARRTSLFLAPLHKALLLAEMDVNSQGLMLAETPEARVLPPMLQRCAAMLQVTLHALCVLGDPYLMKNV